MSGQGYMFAIGFCFGCKRRIAFDPHLVPSIPIGSNGRPSDLGGEPPYENEPVCSDCIGRANEIRRRDGREEIRILPGAYGP